MNISVDENFFVIDLFVTNQVLYKMTSTKSQI